MKMELFIEPKEGVSLDNPAKWHVSNISIFDLAKGDRY